MKILRKRWVSRTLAASLAALAACPSLLAAEQPVIPARPGGRSPRALPEAVNGGIPLSLNDALALALANSADLDVSVNTAEASRYNLMISRGIFDPLVQAQAIRSHTESPATSTLVGASVNTVDNFDARASVQQLLPIGGTVTLGYDGNRTSSNSKFAFVNPAYGSTLTLSLSQPLLRNFGLTPTYWQIKIARNAQSSAYLDFVRSVQTVVNGVEQAYWDLVYAIENLKVKQESLKIAQDLNRITKIKIDVGSLAPIDIVQTEVGIAQAEQDIITAEGLIGDAQDRLKRNMNFDQARWTKTPIVPTDRVQADEMVSIRIDDATRVALDRRPEVQQALYQARSDQVRYQYWKNEALPGLNLVGSYGNPGIGGKVHLTDANGNPIGTIPGDFGDAVSQTFNRKYKNWSLGLQFSYPILNRAGRGSLGAAKYTFESSKARLTTTEQNVQLDVRAAARAIDTAARSIVAARKGRELAERNLDAERKKFENGMSTTFQVNQIQRDLSAARTNEMQALAIYRKAVAAFHFSVADSLEWKGVKVEAAPDDSPSMVELRREVGP